MTEQLAFDWSSPLTQGPSAAPDSGPVVVRLKKAFSWQSTYYRYPYYLAQADPQRVYTKEQVYTLIFQTGSLPPSSGKGQSDWLKVSFGLGVDRSSREVTIEGIGLIEKVADDGYRLSEGAVELGRCYAEDRSGERWRLVFAEILARNDVRTRIVLYHLGILGYTLHFPHDPGPGGFGARMSHAELVSRGETLPFLLDARKDVPPPKGSRRLFNQLLDRYPIEALGPFLASKIAAEGLDLSAGIEFQGGTLSFGGRTKAFSEPSTNDLGLYLKQSLSLFADIGVLAYDSARRSWAVDFARAAEVFSHEAVCDLFADRRDALFEACLRKWYAEIADPEGLVRIHLLRDRVCEEMGIPAGECIRYFDRQAARLISEKRLSIRKTLGWHGSATDCLFGDRSKQYVELVF